MGQSFGFLSSTAIDSFIVSSISTTSTCLNSKSLRTATSLAIPRILRQSPRLGVKSRSIKTSSRPRTSVSSSPGTESSDSSMIPSCSSPKPSSLALQSIPSDSTPRNLAFLILRFPLRLVPTLASAVFNPTRALEAPHTT